MIESEISKYYRKYIKYMRDNQKYDTWVDKGKLCGFKQVKRNHIEYKSIYDKIINVASVSSIFNYGGFPVHTLVF